MKLDFKKLKDKFGFLFNSKNKTGLIFILGIIGILLIFISGICENNEQSKNTTNNSEIEDNTDEFITKTQNELCDILNEIEGVGEVRVMITVSGTTELEYAQELTKDSDSDSQSYKNQYVFVEENGQKQALVKKVNKPQICGVCVVCRGGDNIKVIEKVTRTVSTVLDISSANVCVMPLKQ